MKLSRFKRNGAKPSRVSRGVKIAVAPLAAVVLAAITAAYAAISITGGDRDNRHMY